MSFLTRKEVEHLGRLKAEYALEPNKERRALLKRNHDALRHIFLSKNGAEARALTPD